MKHTVQAIVLAAGRSTRFPTEKTKLSQSICGQPMIVFSAKLLASLGIAITIVVGHEKETIQHILSRYQDIPVTYITQEEQLGTGHALACSQPLWDKENILVINGDMPLVSSTTIIDLFEQHQKNNACISFVTSCTPDKNITQSYGRVISDNNKIAIVEAKDFTGDATQYCCVNAGIYLIKKDFLVNYIQMLNSNNANNEFYITDLVNIASENNKTVIKVSAPFDSIRGVNTLEELFIIEQIKRKELMHYWMDKGVRFLTDYNIHIDVDVTIGHDSCIEGNVYLKGKTSIGDNVYIHPFSIINNSTIQSQSYVGPFAYIKNNILIPAPAMTHKAVSTPKYNKQTNLHPVQQRHEDENGFSFTGARLVHHDILTEEQ